MAVYYIDFTTGDDADTGLTEALAWKTYDKVRTTIAAGVTAGDEFLFKCGETFVPAVSGVSYSTISLNGKNGNSGAYCKLGSYGTGAKPVIDHRYAPTGTWVDDGGNKWHIAPDRAITDVRRCFLDGVESVEAANAGAINGTDHLWFYNTTTHVLYLYSTSNPGGRTVSLVVGADSNCIWVNNSSYWKFENIEWRGGHEVFELGSTACSYLEWNDCEMNYGSSAQIMSYNDLAGDGHHHLTINGCTFDGKGALISKAVTEAELADTWLQNLIQFDKSVNYVTITGCTFRDGYHSHVNTNAAGASGNGINYVVISGNSHYGTNSPYVRPFQFVGPSGKCTNNQFVRNFINDVNVRAQVGGTGNLVAYNIWDTVRVSEETTTARENAICLYADAPDVCTNNLIYNNIFYNINQEGVWLNLHDGATTGNVIANNIFWNCGQRLTDNSPYKAGAAITVDTGISDTNHFHNNCVYNDSEVHVITHEGTQYTVAEAEAAEATVYSGNIQGDPLCVSTTDFRLTGSSPCINVGLDVGLTEDYAGTAVPQGATPDMGAYEYYVDTVLKRWNGASWSKAKTLVYLSGTWQSRPIKRWTGAEWIDVDGLGN